MHKAIGLYNLFQNIAPLPDDFWNDFYSGATENEYRRKTLLVRNDKVCTETHFIIKGLARAFYYKNDTDVSSRFMRENDLIIPVKAGYENIELMEDSRLITFSNSHLSYLYKKYPQLNYITRTLTERYYLMSEERGYAMRMKSGRERYEALLSQDPQIFQRVPLKYIASYLGMKPETLSRIRSRIRY